MTKIKRMLIINIIFTVLGMGVSSALEIPLGHSEGTGRDSTDRIGYVDMERIFQIYPQTKSAKEDFLKKREKMREDLSAKEIRLQEVRQKMAVLESTLISKPPAQNPDVDPLFGNGEPAEKVSADSISQTKKELEELEIEFEEARSLAQKDLTAFESRQTQIIFGKIYSALQELADEEQVDLVVDKSSILFGSASIDLTEKLQKKVRGF